MKRRTFTKLSLSLALTSLAPQRGLFAEGQEDHATDVNTRESERWEEEVVQHYLKLGAPALRFTAPKGSEANIAPVRDRFQRATGAKVSLHLLSVDDIASTIIAETLSNKQSFDVALPATFSLPDLVKIEALTGLTQYAQKHEPTSLRGGILYPHGDSFQDQFFGYQMDGDCYVMFYQEALLNDKEHQKRFSDTSGHPLRIPRTWQELDAQIEYFSQAPGVQYGGSLFRNPEYVAWEWWLRFHATGELPFDDEVNPRIHLEGGVTALENLVAISSFLDPRTKRDGLFENWQSFSRGNSYCNIGWGGTQKYIRRTNPKLALRYGPTPGGTVNGEHHPVSHFNWGWSTVVGSQSPHPEASYLYTLFCALPHNSATAVAQANGFFDPFREEHYSDPRIQEIYSEEFLSVHRTSLSNAIPDLYLPQRGELWRVLSQAIVYALEKKLTPKAALTAAAKRWDKIIQQGGKRDYITLWRALKNRYPKSYNNHLSPTTPKI